MPVRALPVCRAPSASSLPSFCRVGFTCRCIHSTLFGIPTLPGGQAQYARIPKAGGTLFSLTALAKSDPHVLALADSSLLLLADILPTGVFAALQALQHPKLSPLLTGSAYPSNPALTTPLQTEDRTLTIAVVGLGPVGVVRHLLAPAVQATLTCTQCATVSLLHMLQRIREDKGIDYRVVAIDPNESRRAKMDAVYARIGQRSGALVVAAIDEAKELAALWTGCNAVLEVSPRHTHVCPPPPDHVPRRL